MLDVILYILTSVAMLLAVWYVLGWFWGGERQNVQWQQSLKSGRVSVELRRYYFKYPDKQRFILFWLQAQRINDFSPDAVMAELGVYKGATARLLQLLQPQRELFLFDTFSGFQSGDLANETGKAATYTTANFADTTVSLVKERLGSSEKIHYFRGDFSSIQNEIPHRDFILVSIDVDLGQPTLAGLNYFYPRLLPGGVIIVHDYNDHWPALKAAVDHFLQTIPEEPVLIPDRNNSLVIVKNCPSFVSQS